MVETINKCIFTTFTKLKRAILKSFLTYFIRKITYLQGCSYISEKKKEHFQNKKELFYETNPSISKDNNYLFSLLSSLSLKSQLNNSQKIY